METIDYNLSDEEEFKDLFDMSIHKGTIVSVDIANNKAEVNIDDIGVKSDVPIFYHCQDNTTVAGATAFSADDRVWVINQEGGCEPSVSNLKVVGFVDELKECLETFILVECGAYVFLFNQTGYFYPPSLPGISYPCLKTEIQEFLDTQDLAVITSLYTGSVAGEHPNFDPILDCNYGAPPGYIPDPDPPYLSANTGCGDFWNTIDCPGYPVFHRIWPARRDGCPFIYACNFPGSWNFSLNDFPGEISCYRTRVDYERGSYVGPPAPVGATNTYERRTWYTPIGTMGYQVGEHGEGYFIIWEGGLRYNGRVLIDSVGNPAGPRTQNLFVRTARSMLQVYYVQWIQTKYSDVPKFRFRRDWHILAALNVYEDASITDPRDQVENAAFKAAINNLRDYYRTANGLVDDEAWSLSEYDSYDVLTEAPEYGTTPDMVFTMYDYVG